MSLVQFKPYIPVFVNVASEASQRQINALSTVVNHVLEQITHSREDCGEEATVRAAQTQTFG